MSFIALILVGFGVGFLLRLLFFLSLLLKEALESLVDGRFLGGLLPGVLVVVGGLLFLALVFWGGLGSVETSNGKNGPARSKAGSAN